MLDETHANLRIGKTSNAGKYIVRVPRDSDNATITEEIRQLIADCSALYNEDKGTLPRIHFDRHLYQPLLVERNGITSSPAGLNSSEEKFVSDLRDYCTNESGALPEGAELFLLRNLGRGKGVSFFESSGFYPDFILWIKSDEAQRIVFVEPHGMVHAGPHINDEKAQLYEKLPNLSKEAAARSQMTNITMDSFIVSATPYAELKQIYDDGSWDLARFTTAHILFPTRDGEYDYLEHILQGYPAPQRDTDITGTSSDLV